MQILLQEMKKIFHPIMIFICIFINLLMYYLFIEFHITHFPNGRPALDHYRIATEMVHQYGAELDQEEFNHFKDIY